MATKKAETKDADVKVDAVAGQPAAKPTKAKAVKAKAVKAKAAQPAKAKVVSVAKAKAVPAKAKAVPAKAKPGKAVPRAEDEVEDLVDELGADVEDDAATDKPSGRKAGKSSGKRAGALVVVESPAKAKTITKYLGAGFVVKASVGHVKDLPKKNIGVDIQKGFSPDYVVIDGKKKVLAEIKAAAKKVDQVFLAPDPDREGEAIAWHIAEEIRDANPNIKRVLFNEITKKAVNEAIEHPIELNPHKFDSQQARRILDRLVGYEISPVLWTKVKRGLSAGRVQSVAVRLVVEREDEIKAFKPEEYWTLDVDVEGASPPPFTARGVRLDGEKLDLRDEGKARAAEAIVKSNPLVVAGVERKERRKNPPAPFITSKLQQEASSKLRFSPKKTMGLAQRLYEGMELGEEGPVGLITYMRTDSTRLSDDALREVRTFIGEKYGQKSVPEAPNVFKTKKSAQDAHEAIRPTSTKYDPETVRRLIEQSGGGGRDPKETEDLLKLYTLIWNRFVACQMVPAVFDQTSIEIKAGRVDLRATGQVLKSPGFLEVYREIVEDAADEDAEGRLPDIHEGETLKLLATKPEQHFTQPPPRFSEATLVKELEEKRHWSPVDLRHDPLHRTRPRLRRAQRRPAVSHRARRHGQRAARQQLSRDRQHRLHRPDGRAARQGRGGRGRLGEAARLLLRAVQAGRGEGEGGDARRQARRDPHRHQLRKVWRHHGHQVGSQRALPRLFGLSRVQEHQGIRPRRRWHHSGGRHGASVWRIVPDL